MTERNVEIKARCSDPRRIREALKAQGADFRGIDRQIDTYFRAPSGRLKLREGNIENALIFYNRPDRTGPKAAEVTLCRLKAPPQFKRVLAEALGILATVHKSREIYFVGNVKFHIDSVDKLGSFVEIEANDSTGEIGEDKLLLQCRRYMELLGISEEDLIDCSYSDMVISMEEKS